MLVADFYKGTKRKPCTVDFSVLSDGARRHVDSLPIKDKREARAEAKRRNAVCWNF